MRESLLHRGESLELDVREESVTRPRVESAARQTGGGACLVVTVPRGLTETGRERTVAVAVRAWAWRSLLLESRRLAALLAARMERRVADVRLTRARTRWGSYSATGVIRVNVVLAAAPPDLLEYLVAHEVAHLRWRGHGPRFHAQMDRLLPDWQERRRRLRDFEKAHPDLLGAP